MAMGLPLAMTGVIALPLPAQTMRTYDYGRPFKGEKQLRAVVEFGAGKLTVQRGPADRLYGMVLQYDADRFQPVGHYSAATAEVQLGATDIGSGGIRVDLKKALPQIAVIELAPSVDLTLDVSIGAAEGNLDLSGLRVAGLALKSGASRTAVSFGAPNPGSCRSAQITSGAGELTITAAGNSGCRSWRFDGGVGAVTIDLAGAWPADARMTLNMALGGITLRAPKSLGLRVMVDGFMSGFDAKGFVKSGKSYTSANYEKATRHLDVELRSALGGVDVVWQ